MRKPPKDQNEAGIAASTAIDQFGGTSAFAQWWVVSKQTVSEWRRYGFPARTFYEMSNALTARGINCDPIAWKQLASASGVSPSPAAEAPAERTVLLPATRSRATISPILERPTLKARRDHTRRVGEPTPCEEVGDVP